MQKELKIRLVVEGPYLFDVEEKIRAILSQAQSFSIREIEVAEDRVAVSEDMQETFKAGNRRILIRVGKILDQYDWRKLCEMYGYTYWDLVCNPNKIIELTQEDAKSIGYH